MSEAFSPTERVALAPYTTFELGGEADFFVEARDRATFDAALCWANANGQPVHVLGGGSNVIVPDDGVRGLVIRLAFSEIEWRNEARVIVSAGYEWNAFVALAVSRGLQGIECLAGIPGTVGATPIQNVGAYGQQVSDVIAHVEVIDRQTLQSKSLAPDECEFSYRNSVFKANPDRYFVTAVEFELKPNAPPLRTYAEVRDNTSSKASLSEVRDTVLRLRGSKSMLVDRDDPNHRNAGSFFTNPIVDDAVASEIRRCAVERGFVKNPNDVPSWPDGTHTKLSAGWLIERSGFQKGNRHGAFGISTKHALCLVHYGGGSSRELLEFADKIARSVKTEWSVALDREPRIFGKHDLDSIAT
ncbi:MAG: UDP-N-acetylmuramate dehydrogenase [Polyangiales bacterium]